MLLTFILLFGTTGVLKDEEKKEKEMMKLWLIFEDLDEKSSNVEVTQEELKKGLQEDS